MNIGREARRLDIQKGSRILPVQTKPFDGEGNDGDMRILATGTDNNVLYVKMHGRWHGFASVDKVKKIEDDISSRDEETGFEFLDVPFMRTYSFQVPEIAHNASHTMDISVGFWFLLVRSSEGRGSIFAFTCYSTGIPEDNGEGSIREIQGVTTDGDPFSQSYIQIHRVPNKMQFSLKNVSSADRSFVIFAIRIRP